MVQPLTVPIIGALALVGVAGGVQLGRSAIAEINPAYYSDPETRFHADLSPYRSPSVDPPRVLAGADLTGLGRGCVGCRTYPEEYYPVQDPAVEPQLTREAAGPEPAELAEAEPQPDPEADRLQRDIEKVRQYASGMTAAEPAPVLASAEPAPAEAQRSEKPAED